MKLFRRFDAVSIGGRDNDCFAAETLFWISARRPDDSPIMQFRPAQLRKVPLPSTFFTQRNTAILPT